LDSSSAAAAPAPGWGGADGDEGFSGVPLEFFEPETELGRTGKIWVSFVKRHQGLTRWRHEEVRPLRPLR